MFSWYKYLIVNLVFSHLGFWSGNLFLITPFPDFCLLVPFLSISLFSEKDAMLCDFIQHFFEHYALSEKRTSRTSSRDWPQELLHSKVSNDSNILLIIYSFLSFMSTFNEGSVT